MIKEAIEALSRSSDLSAPQMQGAMEEIMTGRADTKEIVDFLILLNRKGETEQELIAAALVMRKHAVKVHLDKEVILDTCGTGGDKKGIFNVSTAAAFVASGLGITVAKHGNRSVSSHCGSADILEALGIDIHMPVELLRACLEEVGIAFLFAPDLHPAMKYAMPARKEIGTRTIFNILGPLTNPAGATHQLVGVYDRRWTEVLAVVLSSLKTSHALVVHSEDGLDEIATTARTYVSEVKKGKFSNYEITPEEFGFKRALLGDLNGKTIPQNAEIMLSVLGGEAGPYRDIVLFNAAAAIYAADEAKSIREGVELAKLSIDSGKALQKLKALKEFSLRKK